MRRGAWLASLLGLALLFSCFSQSLEDRLGQGLDLLYEGRYEDAESHFLSMARELSRTDSPENRTWQAQALYHAGRIEHLYLGQPRRAVARLRESLKLNPHAVFAFDARKEIAFIFYDRLRDYRTAALEFERLVQAFPERDDIAEFHYRMAQCYFLLREFNQARTEAKLLLAHHKKEQNGIRAETLLLIANSYYVEGRYQEAADAHRMLLSVDLPQEIESRSLFELGMCLQELGEYKEAEKNLMVALSKHPRPDLVRMQLATLQSVMKEEDDGVLEKLPYATAARKKVGEPDKKPPAPSPAPKPTPKPAPKTPKPEEKEAVPKPAPKPAPAPAGAGAPKGTEKTSAAQTAEPAVKKPEKEEPKAAEPKKPPATPPADKPEAGPKKEAEPAKKPEKKAEPAKAKKTEEAAPPPSK